MTLVHNHHTRKSIDNHKRLSAPASRAQEKAAGLPGEGTDEGALARLFLAEVLVPNTDDMREVRREMDMMHCVLINRLQHPADFDAGRHASTLTQIISAREGQVQFQGFENYPILGGKQQSNIDGILSAALDARNPLNGLAAHTRRIDTPRSFRPSGETTSTRGRRPGRRAAGDHQET